VLVWSLAYRLGSSGGMKPASRLPHLVAEEAAEVTLGSQLDLTADHVTELQLHR